MKPLPSSQSSGGNRVIFDPASAVELPATKSLFNVQGRYAVIYADPPWHFATYSPRGEARSAAAHYNCMPFSDLCQMPVREHAAPDCCLFLWTTDPMLPKALELIAAWGFTYKTVAFTWVKVNRRNVGSAFSSGDFFTGMGYWTRANPEQCLLATIGRPKRLSMAVKQLVIAPRREHSRKPDEVYRRIESLVSGPYLELYARHARPGWTACGDQVGLFDTGRVTTRKVPSTRFGRDRQPDLLEQVERPAQ